MVRYVKCPRCELNYIDAEKQEYCDPCLKEMKGIRTDFDEIEEEDDDSLTELCPICEENMMRAGEKMCEECRAKQEREEAEPEDDEEDDEWREYLDDTPELDEEIEDIGETFDEDEEEEEEEEETYEDEEEDLEYVTGDEIYTLGDDDDEDEEDDF